MLTGFALAFARAVGEYGSVIFIAGNLPNISEIAPLLIVIRLSEFRYADATAIAVVMLVVVVRHHLHHQSPAALVAIPRDHQLSHDDERDAADARNSRERRTSARSEPAIVRYIIIALAVTFLTIFVVLPLVIVFTSAFSRGVGAYLARAGRRGSHLPRSG